MDLGNYTGGGAGFGTSTADQSMAASGTTGSIGGGYSGGGGNDGGNDPYARYVEASKPRTGIAAIKDYFTGRGYDYGYQPTFARTLGGVGPLLLGLINPALGLAYKGYQTFKPEFNMFRNSPTIEAYLNQRKNLYAEDELPTLTNKTLDYYKSIYNPGGVASINIPNNISNFYADITQKDKAMMQTPTGQMMDYDTFKAISGNDTLTPQEFEQLRSSII